MAVFTRTDVKHDDQTLPEASFIWYIRGLF